MNLWTYSANAMEAIAPHDEPHIIISIRTPGGPKIKVRRGPATRDVLFIAFPDLSWEYKALPMILRGGGKYAYTDDQLFSVSQAKEILAFVERHKDVESILINCEGGVSRSPAVAAALGQILHGVSPPYDGTNRLVYETLLAASSAKVP